MSKLNGFQSGIVKWSSKRRGQVVSDEVKGGNTNRQASEFGPLDNSHKTMIERLNRDTSVTEQKSRHFFFLMTHLNKEMSKSVIK